ncbi:hypothetical protein IJ384_01205, partial [bacterium]|nr:hypothetical protein [bacterium]
GLEASDDLIVDEDKVTSEEFEIEEASSISDGSFEVDYTQNDKQEEFQKVNEVLSTSVYEEESTNNTQYSTNVTPSIESYEDESVGDNLEELLNNDASIFEENNNVDGDEDLNAENTAQIEELFSNNELGPDVDTEETYVQPSKKGGSKIIPLFGMLAIVAAIGYFGYTKFMNGELSKESLPVQNSVREKKNVSQKPVSSKPSKVAMPIETVDNVESKPQVDEGNAISLPDIEKNLDASILVSNLSVSWEVPASYLSSNTAKRYFTKMGKIIQLNLKTELLLLNKQPVTNKIRLELEFNKNSNKFDVKAVTTSSGEKVVDEVITQTVNNALNLNIKTNMSNFGNMAGNPVLIINL